jgi:hypothetical protein
VFDIKLKAHCAFDNLSIKQVEAALLFSPVSEIYSKLKERRGGLIHMKCFRRLLFGGSPSDAETLCKSSIFGSPNGPFQRKTRLQRQVRALPNTSAVRWPMRGYFWFDAEPARRAVTDSSVFVFTLGLTEAWINRASGHVYRMCPGTEPCEFDPAQHEFRNFSHEKIRRKMSWWRQVNRSRPCAPWLGTQQTTGAIRTMSACFTRDKLGSSASEATSALGQRSGAPAPPTAAIFDSAQAAGDPIYPNVLLAILAKQKESVLPLYLMCIDALDYPKDRIVLYVRTNNNTDRTADILRNWLERGGHQYAHVEFDASDVIEPVEKFAVQEWNPTRFKVLARIRQQSMQFALDAQCDYYFVVDVDNFLKPHTLKSLAALNLQIVAPLLRHEDQTRLFSNYHEKIDARGYFLQSDEYNWILFQRVKGLCQVPVVHSTYLVRRDAIPLLYYEDGSGRHEYVIFSDSARRQGIPQYLDNRDIYGYLSLDESSGASVRQLGASVAVCAKKADITAARSKRRAAALTRSLTPIFIHSSWRTSSTWFWSKFRQLPATLAFYEPVHQFLNSITEAQALTVDYKMWGSRHSPTEPYFLEYVPLVRRGGGVRLFEPSIPYRWFIPSGGLRGDLRSQERRYLALLVREAQRRGRVPVLGFCRSLGRISAIKKEFGGLNIFLFRNLWSQWISYLALKNRGDRSYYDTVQLLVNRADDKFLAYLANYYIERAARAEGRSEPAALAGTPEGYRLLSSVAEPDAFGMFMGLHIYLYLHAQLTADVTVDVTRMALDDGYRTGIEGDLRQRTDLPLSFSDIWNEKPKLLDIDTNAIDWAAIREHGQNAVHALGAIADVEQLAESAMAFVAGAFDQSSLQFGRSEKNDRGVC